MKKALQPFDREVMEANLFAQQVKTITPELIEENGGKKVGEVTITMTAEAHLRTLERLVQDHAKGKVFGDGEVFDAIEDERKIVVQLYKYDDGSGASIASIEGGIKAIDVMFRKVGSIFEDLDLMPKGPRPLVIREQEAAEQNKERKDAALVTLADGSLAEVKLSKPKKFKEEDFEEVNPMDLAGEIPMMPARNPMAAKLQIKSLLCDPVQRMANRDAGNLVLAMLNAAGEVHPADEKMPEGIKVVAKFGEEVVEYTSPKELLRKFDAVVNEKEAEMDTNDVMAAFKAKRNKI